MGMAKLGSEFLIHEEAIRNIHPKQNVSTLLHQMSRLPQVPNKTIIKIQQLAHLVLQK